MAVTGNIRAEIKMPQGVSARFSDGALVVKGKAGEVTRRFHFGRVAVEVRDGITLTLEMPRKQEMAEFNTIASEIRTAVEGAEKGFEYRLKIVYAHFPIKVQVKGNEVIIENFLGERYPRKARIMGKAKVSISGDQVTVSSVDVEEAGQTAANIEKATRIKNYDRRVFQDGIYIVEKAGKVLA